MKIIGVSIGVEVGATLTKSVMISIANKILVQGKRVKIEGQTMPYPTIGVG